MNISKYEQRVLHALAQGGAIHFERGQSRKIKQVFCLTRDGYRLSDCSLSVFQRLKRKRLIESRQGSPYRISRLGRLSVRAQPDNRA